MSDIESSDESLSGSNDVLNQSQNDERNESQERPQHDATASVDDPTVIPRHHSYLPGTVHPLYPETLWRKQRRSSCNRQWKTTVNDPDHPRRELLKLAILELDGVVFFPGQTLPLRLRNPRWRTYIGDMNVPASSEATCIGVVTRKAPPLSRQRRSWLRTAMPRRPIPLELLLEVGMEEHNGNDENDSVHSAGEGGGLPDHEEDEMEDGNGEGEDDVNATENHALIERSSEYAQNNVNESGRSNSIVRRLLGSSSRSDVVSTNEVISERSHDRRRRSVRRRLIGRGVRSSDNVASSIRQEDSDIDAPASSRSRQQGELESRPVETISSVESAGHSRGQNGESHGNTNHRHRPQDSRPRRNVSEVVFPSDPDDPLVGKVGTMAIIANRYGGDDTDLVNVGDPFGAEREQVIVTAVGTNVRFRVVSCVDEGIERRDDSGHGDMALVRIYWCEELCDAELSLPPFPFCRKPGVSSADASDDPGLAYFQFHNRISCQMAHSTPLPFFVYNRFWPWRLVGLIRNALDRIDAFEGLRKNLPALEERQETDSTSLLEPAAFSFWMATHMSLTEDEKLMLLKMLCPIERLFYIYDRVLEQEQEKNETIVCCRICRTQLSRASSMFTVGGAEGTTGAYVNEYGIVHQTMTFRQVDEDHMYYQGRPETRDSWFPGYSWTIANCRYCYSHLGWKFLLGGGAETGSNHWQDRPAQFWGMSGASVTTSVNATAGVR